MTFPLSIYIHWPFCKSKCPYCDFNSHVRDKVEHARWRAALLAELATYAVLLPQAEVVSIFFGGGTPSLMEADTVAALIEAASGHWRMAAEVEITLEANPTSVEAEKFRAFRAAGVSRVSLGIQSLREEALRFLGRQHNAEEAREAIRLARELFPRMTFDLIYARPGQTLAAWEQELTEALEMAKGHLSLYQLTIEENTAFHAAHRRGELPMPEDDHAAALYERTAEIMQAHGMPAYEVSNYAAPGQESRHNLAYWRGDSYIGIGPGAHGRYAYMMQKEMAGGAPATTSDQGGAQPQRRLSVNEQDDKEQTPLLTIATENIKSPERWLEQMETTHSALAQRSVIEPAERRRELVMMGLRLTSGINYADWQKRTGLDVREAIAPDAVRRMIAAELLVDDGKKLQATPKGMLMLNSIAGALLVDANL